MVVIACVNLVVLLFLAVDRWVHGQKAVQTDQGRSIVELQRGLLHIDAQFERVNEEASKRWSETQSRLTEMELDMRELKTVVRLRRHPRREGV